MGLKVEGFPFHNGEHCFLQLPNHPPEDSEFPDGVCIGSLYLDYTTIFTPAAQPLVKIYLRLKIRYADGTFDDVEVAKLKE